MTVPSVSMCTADWTLSYKKEVMKLGGGVGKMRVDLEKNWVLSVWGGEYNQNTLYAHMKFSSH